MNVRAHLPAWSQAPTQRFLQKQTVEGASYSPLTEDEFVESFKLGSGAAHLAGYDEVPGEDDALGQLGIVSRNGLKVHYQGDTSDSRGDFEAVLTAKRRGVEYVTYVHGHGPEYSVLRMVNDEGTVELKGSQVQNTASGPQGTLVAGSFQV